MTSRGHSTSYVAALHDAFAAIASYAGISFNPVLVPESSHIRIYGLDDIVFDSDSDGSPDPLAGYASFPNPGVGYLWAVFDQVGNPGTPPLDPNYVTASDGRGTRDFYAIHEILHTLGFDHPTYGTDPDLLASDHTRFTALSYNKADARDAGHIATPMALDVAALHHLYGGKAKATGNTIYKIIDDGETLNVDISQGPIAIGRAYYTIWDTDGTDEISYAGSSRRALINLNEATLSTDDSPFITALAAAFSAHPDYSSVPNFVRHNLTLSEYSAGGFISALFDDNGLREGGYMIANSSIANQKRAVANETLFNVGIENATGGGNDDILIGNAITNRIAGSAGEDFVFAAAGDDILIGGSGSDHLNGGTGIDVIDYSAGQPGNAGITSGIQVDMSLSTGQVTNDGFGDTDTLIDIERIIGTSMVDVISLLGSTVGMEVDAGGEDDRITGSDEGDNLKGGAGNDVIQGRAGADTIDGGSHTLSNGDGDTASYADSDSAVTIRMGTLAAQVGGHAEGDVLINVERILGSAHGDTFHSAINPSSSNVVNNIDGGGGDDKFYDAAGAHRYFGGDGNDTFYWVGGSDRLYGGFGFDTVDITGYSGNMTMGLGGSMGLYALDMEQVVSRPGQVTVAGLENSVPFLAEHHFLGGSEIVTFDGAGGLSRVDYSASNAAVDINLANAIQSGGDAEGDTLSSIESVIGSRYGDSIRGDSAANTLHGMAGIDRLHGQGGADILYGGADEDYAWYSDSLSRVVIDLGQVIQQGGDAEGDRFYSIESVVASNHDDEIRAKANPSIVSNMIGGGGDDIIFDAVGRHRYKGGLDNDTFVYAGGADLVYGDGGFDTFDLTAVNDTFVFRPSTLSLVGSSSIYITDVEELITRAGKLTMHANDIGSYTKATGIRDGMAVDIWTQEAASSFAFMTEDAALQLAGVPSSEWDYLI